MTDDRPSTGGKNPLLVPLVVVSMIAIALGVAVVVLVTRERSTPVPPSPSPVGVAPAAQAPAPTPAPAPAPAKDVPPPRGKVGQRVESAGLGITVEKVVHEPQTYKDQVTIGPDQRYVAMLIAVENSTGGNAQLFPSQFTLRDDQGFTYNQLGVHGTMPALEWRTLANRETTRGYADFLVPKAAKGLVLVYADVSRGNGAQPIQIELGE